MKEQEKKKEEIKEGKRARGKRQKERGVKGEGEGCVRTATVKDP